MEPQSAKKLGKNELTSNDCNTDHPVSGSQANCFLPSETEILHPTSSNAEEIFYEPPQNGFIPEEISSDMLAHEIFNGAIRPVEDDLDENDDQDSTISPVFWVQRQMIEGVDPRRILGDLLPKGTNIPFIVNDSLLWRLIVNLLREPKRLKLEHFNTLDDVIYLLKTSKKIMVLTGAGVSVSCGIPDFRSRDGVYARLKKDYPALPDPQAMFDIQYFRKDPRPFFKFAKEIYPGQFQPSPSHRFMKVLESQNKLLRNYSQNIDTLEHAAGIQNVITCHGSFATATCTCCGHKVDSSSIKDDIFQQTIPYCPICPSDLGQRGIMKPDIVFFGEGLSNEFHEAMAADKDICDLLIVMGSSLKVRPVAMIPTSIPTNVPQILINREPLEHLTFDIELLGDCDVIIGELCRRLESDWEIDERIPRFDLKEITVQKTEIEAVINPEVNNNSDNATEMEPAPSMAQNEESNSCDYRGLSAIKLDDSEDGSNPEQTSSSSQPLIQTNQKPETVEDKALWPTDSKESISKRIPDHSYLFFPPSRYIFSGAEVYKDANQDPEEDRCCSTPTDYSSDCDSPSLPNFESSADFFCGARSGVAVPADSSSTQEPVGEDSEQSPNTSPADSSSTREPVGEDSEQSPNT